MRRSWRQRTTDQNVFSVPTAGQSTGTNNTKDHYARARALKSVTPHIPSLPTRLLPATKTTRLVSQMPVPQPDAHSCRPGTGDRAHSRCGLHDGVPLDSDTTLPRWFPVSDRRPAPGLRGRHPHPHPTGHLSGCRAVGVHSPSTGISNPPPSTPNIIPLLMSDPNDHLGAATGAPGDPYGSRTVTTS